METINYRLKNGVVVATMTKGLNLELEDAIYMVEERLRFQDGNEYPVMVKLNGLKFASSKARSYMQNEGLKGIKAGAFIITNPVEKIIMNFLILINRPVIPTKMFTSEQEALNWLEHYK